MPRNPALLTSAQREFLRGEKTYEHEQSAKDMRYKIRSRVRDGLFDLALLFQEMDRRDREQLIKDTRVGQLRDDDQPFTDEVFREDEPTSLIYALAFLYQVADDVGFDFEKFVELAVVAAQEENPMNPFAARSVDVTIEEDFRYDFDHIQQRIEAGQHLSEPEFLSLLRLLLSDLDTFVELAEQTGVHIEAKLEAEEDLSRGESLVAVGRYLAYPVEFDKDRLLEQLDERVVSATGIANVGWA